MKTTYCCPFCKFETNNSKDYMEHLVTFHDFPKNIPKIINHVIIRVEYP